MNEMKELEYNKLLVSKSLKNPLGTNIDVSYMPSFDKDQTMYHWITQLESHRGEYSDEYIDAEIFKVKLRIASIKQEISDLKGR